MTAESKMEKHAPALHGRCYGVITMVTIGRHDLIAWRDTMTVSLHLHRAESGRAKIGPFGTRSGDASGSSGRKWYERLHVYLLFTSRTNSFDRANRRSMSTPIFAVTAACPDRGFAVEFADRQSRRGRATVQCR